VVPRADGTPPPNWPVGFDRAALRAGPIAAVTLIAAVTAGARMTCVQRPSVERQPAGCAPLLAAALSQ